MHLQSMRHPDAQIVLLEGTDFHSADQHHFMKRLYDSFCLLSWSVISQHISVISQSTKDHHKIKQRLFVTKQQRKCHQHKEYLLTQQQEDTHLNQKRVIYATLYQLDHRSSHQDHTQKHQQMPSEHRLASQIVFQHQNSHILITVFLSEQDRQILDELSRITFQEMTDSERFNYFDMPNKRSSRHSPRQGDFQYYYLQPLQRRYFKPEGYHLNLAFQGGGAKGVSYVGAYSAIQEFQKKIDVELPIRSVIGSSAGGILSLAISVGTPSNQLKDLCLMMDTLTSDLLVQTQRQGAQAQNDPTTGISKHQERQVNSSKDLRETGLQNSDAENSFNSKHKTSIGKGFFSYQKYQLKELMRRYGIIDQHVSQNIIGTLEKPAVQSKLISFLEKSNPTVAKLLTFKQQALRQGEQISCCCGVCSCCRKSKDNCRGLNLYGLAFGALMTGDGVQNIIAYCLCKFLERFVQKNKNNKYQLRKLLQIIHQKSVFEVEEVNLCVKIQSMVGQLKASYADYVQLAHEQKKKNRRILKSQIKYINLDIMILARSFTLQDHYSLTGVEFTCTSVDLQDRILRFFNHKTTPFLPVCRAVQMTGSFPIAFKSLRWEEQWGSYYIHYPHTRRQIKLTGHHFTDGGLLANFPLEFLDNEKFRPMYFSHQKVESKTLWHGFGLDQLQPFPEDRQVNSQVQRLKSQFAKEFGLTFASKTLWTWMTNWSCCQQKQQESEQIKLGTMEFIVYLFLALRDSNRNLNLLCFRPDLVSMEIQSCQDLTSQSNLKRIEREIKAAQNLQGIEKNGHGKQSKITQASQNVSLETTTLNKLAELLSQVDSHYPILKKSNISDSLQAFLSREFKALRDCVTELNQDWISHVDLQQTQKVIEDHLQGLLHPAISVYQKFMAEGQPNSLFFSSALTNQVPLLQLLSHIEIAVRNYYMTTRTEIVQELIEGYRLNAKQYIRGTIKTIIKNCQIIKDNRHSSHLEKALTLRKDQLSQTFMKKSMLTPFIAYRYSRIKQQVDAPMVNINYHVADAFSRQVSQLRQMINHQLNTKIHNYIESVPEYSELNPKLHIILEPIGTSHYYYPNYFGILEGVIGAVNSAYQTSHGAMWKGFNIDIITCSNYHAFFGVLYAMNMPLSQISRHMTLLSSKFKPSQHIEEKYTSQQWMKSSMERAQNAITNAWKQDFDVFSHYQSVYHSQQRQQEMMSLTSQVKNKVQFSQHRMGQAFQSVLDYVSGSFEQIERMETQHREKKFAELLGSKEATKHKNKYGKYALGQFVSYLGELIMAVAHTVLTSEACLNIDESKYEPEVLFKGMLLNKLVDAIDYKIYIFNILEEQNIDPNITLKNFYDSSSTKVLLNFSCVNSTSQCFTFINKKTKPNMPLWAALMAAASLPCLQGQFSSRKQWEACEEGSDMLQRKASQHFKNSEAKGSRTSNAYVSGIVLSTLPIDLLTNHRLINQQLAQDGSKAEDHIELAFSFETSQFSSYELTPKRQNKEARAILNKVARRMEGKAKFIGCCDLMRYFCRWLCCWGCCNEGFGNYFGDLSGQMQMLKMATVRVNAHDNLIFNLYSDSLIKLPIRVGTLDFHLINQDMPILTDTLRQDRAVVQQMLDCLHYSAEKGIIRLPNPDPTIKIQIYQFVMPQRKWDSPWFRIRLKFISLSKWRPLTHRYSVQVIYPITPVQERTKKFDKQPQDMLQNCHQLREDHFDLEIVPSARNFLHVGLAFTYISETKRVQRRVHHLQFSASFIEILIKEEKNKSRFILDLPFKQVFSRKAIEVVAVNFKSNNHRVIKKAVTVITRGLPLSTPHCLNVKCPSYPHPLRAILSWHNPSEVKQQCKHCGICKSNGVIAMVCQVCGTNYCLNCKFSSFITKTRQLDEWKSSLTYSAPSSSTAARKMRVDYAPVNGHNCCLACCKYAYKLRHQEVGPGQQGYNGLYICEACCLALPDSQKH